MVLLLNPLIFIQHCSSSGEIYLFQQKPLGLVVAMIKQYRLHNLLPNGFLKHNMFSQNYDIGYSWFCIIFFLITFW